MRIVQAGYEIINMQDPTEKIERVARVCYKSEDKIKTGSAKKMVKALINSNHTAMIEHASLVLAFDAGEYRRLNNIVSWLVEYKGFQSFLRFTAHNDRIISGNLRAWRDFISIMSAKGFEVSRALERILRSDKYSIYFEDIALMTCEEGQAVEVDPTTLTECEKAVHKDITVLFTVDRGVSHEIVRHRVASFAQESTRYCNYGKSGEVAFIRPCFFEEDTPEMDNWAGICMNAENIYLYLLNEGRTPQEARAVLPNSLKTELVMTANLKEWRHFFNLRAVGVTGKPHPQMREVAVPLLGEFKAMEPVIFGDLVAEV